MALGLEELGRRIRQAREDADLSQRGLADLIDLQDPQSISNYERGITEVPTKRLLRIADATGKPLSYFLPDAEEPFTAGGPGSVGEQVLAALGDLRAAMARVESLLEAQLAPQVRKRRASP